MKSHPATGVAPQRFRDRELESRTTISTAATLTWMRFAVIVVAGLVPVSCSATDTRSDETPPAEVVESVPAATTPMAAEECESRSVSSQTNGQSRLAFTFTGDPTDEVIGVSVVQAIEAVRVGSTTDLVATPVGLGELTDSGFSGRAITQSCDSDFSVAILPNPRSDSLAFVEVVSKLPDCEVARVRVLRIDGRWVLDGFEVGGNEQESALCGR